MKSSLINTIVSKRESPRSPIVDPKELAVGLDNPLLRKLIDKSILSLDDWLELPVTARAELGCLTDKKDLLGRLVARTLLTEYQANRIGKGATAGMVLGNYRLLERLGAGGMGVVYLCEHLVMRRRMAIKVLSETEDINSHRVTRFYSEMRAVSKIQHPNIVNATDAGRLVGSDFDQTVIHYFVMEYVLGKDLESLIRDNGPLPIDEACDVVHQVASALRTAHGHNLIHRDIKPSNIMIGPEEQAKLLDFGLARQYRSRLTDPGTLLGTPDYMAPEQIEDASKVGARTDIFSLGGVLYWCLTGKTPFPSKNIYKDLMNRSILPPPSARSVRAEVPPELDEVIARMMAPNLDDRYPNAQAIMQALLPFLSPILRDRFILSPGRSSGEALWKPAKEAFSSRRTYRVLIVDDDSFTRIFCKSILSQEGIECEEASNGIQALQAAKEKPFDLLLLDVQMPGMTGEEVCRRLRASPPWPNVKIVMLSGTWKSDEMAQIMMAGAQRFPYQADDQIATAGPRESSAGIERRPGPFGRVESKADGHGS